MFLCLGSPTEESLAIIRQSLKCDDRKPEGIDFDSSHPHVFVTLGASVYLIYFLTLKKKKKKKKIKKKKKNKIKYNKINKTKL